MSFRAKREISLWVGGTEGHCQSEIPGFARNDIYWFLLEPESGGEVKTKCLPGHALTDYFALAGIAVPDHERSQYRHTEISSKPSSFHHRSSMC